MARYRMETITDLHKHGYWLQVRCPCGNSAKLSPQKLFKLSAGKSVDGRLDKIEAKLRCDQCGRRPRDVAICLPPDA